MRLPFLSLLLLSTAAPVLAQPEPVAEESAEVQPAPRPDPPRFERQAEAREAPPRRTFEPRMRRDDAPPPAFERRLRRAEREQPHSEPAARIEQQAVAEAPSPRSDPLRDVAREQVFSRGDRPRTAAEGVSAPPQDAVAGWRWREREARRNNRNRDVPPAAASSVFGEAIQTPQTVTRPGRDVSIGSIAAEGVRQDRLRDRAEAERWRRDWRRDHRYDWRRYRNHDRARFHLGIYVDPFGWDYRDWDIGWRLPSRYYASRYWIRDPWMYRLPTLYGPYRWIRYHRDVLLVDLRDGRVVDRIRYFFW